MNLIVLKKLDLINQLEEKGKAKNTVLHFMTVVNKLSVNPRIPTPVTLNTVMVTITYRIVI
jgi:hypothetical protein